MSRCPACGSDRHFQVPETAFDRFCGDCEFVWSIEPIHDMAGFIQKRKSRGRVPLEIIEDLKKRGYDIHAARALIMMHWTTPCENPECPDAGNCDGQCAKTF